jgi:hypothetical protein
MQVVAGEAVQPVRQQVLLDAGQRRDALAVGEQAAVARRDRRRRQQPSIGSTCPNSPAIRRRRAPPPAFDHATAEPVPTISATEERRGASGPK